VNYLSVHEIDLPLLGIVLFGFFLAKKEQLIAYASFFRRERNMLWRMQSLVFASLFPHKTSFPFDFNAKTVLFLIKVIFGVEI